MHRFAAIALSALIAPATAFAAEAAPFGVTVLQGGAPDPSVTVTFALATVGKVNLGTTDAQGQLSFALDAVNLGKVRIEVVVDDCPAEAQDAVYLLGPDGQLPAENADCKRRRAGFFWWGKARRIVVDVGLATLTAQNGRFGKAALIGGPAAAVIGGVALASGGTGAPATTPTSNTTTSVPTTSQPTTVTPQQPTPTPGGSYVVITLVILDPDGHQRFINLAVTLLEVAGAASPLMMTGDGNFQPIQVTLASDGTLRGEGSGTFAGRPNTPFTLSGTLNAVTRQIVIRLEVGGGTLPGGRNALYEIRTR
jgi:hypothetical protein